MRLDELKKINDYFAKYEILSFDDFDYHLHEINKIVEPKPDLLQILKKKEYHRSRRLKKKSYYNESVESLFR